MKAFTILLSSSFRSKSSKASLGRTCRHIFQILFLFSFAILSSQSPVFAESNFSKLSREYSLALGGLEANRGRLLASELQEFHHLLPTPLARWVSEYGGDLRLEPFRKNQSVPASGSGQTGTFQFVRRDLREEFTEKHFEIWSSNGGAADRITVSQGRHVLLKGSAIPLPEGAQKQAFRERIDLDFSQGSASWLSFRMFDPALEDRLWISTTVFPSARSTPPSLLAYPMHNIGFPAAFLLGLEPRVQVLELDGEPQKQIGLVPRSLLQAVDDANAPDACREFVIKDSAEKAQVFGGRPVVQRVRNELLFSPAELHVQSAFVLDPLWEARKLELFTDAQSQLPVYLIEYDLNHELLRLHIYSAAIDAPQLGLLSQLSFSSSGQESFLRVDTVRRCSEVSEETIASLTPSALGQSKAGEDQAS